METNGRLDNLEKDVATMKEDNDYLKKCISSRKKFDVKSGLKKMFGDKEFVTHYWRIYTPALFYGIFYAFGPIIVSNLFTLADHNVMNGITSGGDSVTQGKLINLIFTQGNSLWTAMYFFVVIVVRCGVGAVGNALGKNDKKEIQSLLRLLTYMTIFISVVIMLIICFDSQDALKTLQLVNNQIDNDAEFKRAVTQYINWSAISMLFYGMGMLYQPMFSSYKKTMEQMFAALFGFIFIMIAIPCYILSTSSPNQTLDQIISRSNIVALFVDLYYAVIMLFFVIYCLFPRMIGFQSLNEKVLNNRYHQKNQQFNVLANTRKEIWRTKYFYFFTQQNSTTIFNFYKTGFWFTWEDVKRLVHVGWAVFIDQLIWSIANVFLIIFSTNVSNAAWKPYNAAAKPASLLNNYVYSIANSFAILPAAFVSYELGQGHRKEAKENGWRLYYWGMVTATILMIVVFIIASFMPNLTVTDTSVIGLSVGITMIFGLSVLFNSAYQITLNILFSGGNRWVQINNSLVTVINSFAIIVVINSQIVYNGLWSNPTYADFYGYYVIGKAYVVVKFIIATILLSCTNWLHSSSEVDKKDSNYQKRRIINKNLNVENSNVNKNKYLKLNLNSLLNIVAY